MKLERTISKDIQDVQGMTDQEKAEAVKRRALIAAQLADSVDKKKLIDDDYVEKQIKSWTRGMMDPERGINEKAARKEAETFMKYIKKLNKVN